MEQTATMDGMEKLNEYSPYTKSSLHKCSVRIPDNLLERIIKFDESTQFVFGLSERTRNDQPGIVIKEYAVTPLL